MKNSELEEQLAILSKKHAQAAERARQYEAKLRSAESALETCQTSASYKLGHLLIHEVLVVKDVIKFLYRRNVSRKKAGVVAANALANRSAKRPRVVPTPTPTPTPSPRTSPSPSPRTRTRTPSYRVDALKEGISVVLPTYKGELTILRVLTSLAKQVQPRDLFEIIVVINGEKDDTEERISEYSSDFPDLNIRVFVSEDSGASRARNLGIQEAKYKYTTLIDDDDSVSPNYLSAMYALASDDTIVLSQIVNVDSNGVDPSNAINMQILQCNPDEDNLLKKCSSVLTINACKLVPSRFLKQIKFDTSLKNGEDVAYFCELHSLFSFKYKIATEATYFRFLKQNSISRQPLSFEFNVQDRLLVISRIFNSLDNTTDDDVRVFLQQKISAQISFINSYLKEFPGAYGRTLTEIRGQNLHAFPYHQLWKPGVAKDLIISYCFTPYVDTSAIVMAKRVRERGIFVDVVYNDMNSARVKDERLYALADDLIDKRTPIDSPTSFTQWRAIEEFCTAMSVRLKRLNKSPYLSVYSRVLWPASHFAAFEYKLNNPETKWIAEFSDPVLYDILGNARYSKFNTDWHRLEIMKQLQLKHLSVPLNDNLYFWCEYLAYVFADELIFTNDNQLSYMLSKSDKEIHKIILDKATTKSHPTLSQEYYEIQQSNYRIDNDKVNFAYFGTFYQTRKLNDIIEIVKTLREPYKDKVLIHVFTNTREVLAAEINEVGVAENFAINDYVSFFEFLNLTTQFDCLVLNDAITKPEKSVNPYLPSKLSDYIGGSRPIWVLYEHDSILHRSRDIQYKSELGNISAGCQVMQMIVDDCGQKISSLPQ